MDLIHLSVLWIIYNLMMIGGDRIVSVASTCKMLYFAIHFIHTVCNECYFTQITIYKSCRSHCLSCSQTWRWIYRHITKAPFSLVSTSSNVIGIMEQCRVVFPVRKLHVYNILLLGCFVLLYKLTLFSVIVFAFAVVVTHFRYQLI